MPGWDEILDEIRDADSKIKNPLDFVRRKYLRELHEYTKRNVIAYYSGWLQRPGLLRTGINDEDKNAFMTTIHKLDRTKGLDLILHTPGGETAATESLVDYLRKMFKNDIRAIIPQLSMSAGTMIACSCKEIIMGKQSSLGPIDPQFSGISACGVIEEFNKAITEVTKNPSSISIWREIVSKYPPDFLGKCERARDLSGALLKEWLITGMFEGDKDAEDKASNIAKGFNDHTNTKTHERHIPIDDCQKYGLKIVPLEDDNKLQDIVLSIHHAYMHSFEFSEALKIIENHDGKTIIIMDRSKQQR